MLAIFFTFFVVCVMNIFTFIIQRSNNEIPRVEVRSQADC
jgi:hypothetical protein